MNYSTDKIIDISLSLSQATIVYPNNPKIRISTIAGKTSAHSEIFIGSHTGTHVDAPKHVLKSNIGVDPVREKSLQATEVATEVAPKGAAFSNGVDRLDLSKMVGPCRVLDMTREKESVKVEDLKKANIKKGERILVKTRNSKRGFKRFYDDYVYLDGEAAEFLVKKQIALFGIDYLSVKKRGGADNRPHTELLKNNVIIFEGLDLSKVKPGKYFFVGLPLKFKDLDGSPARAILW